MVISIDPVTSFHIESYIVLTPKICKRYDVLSNIISKTVP
jgi:hypothetical protein